MKKIKFKTTILLLMAGLLYVSPVPVQMNLFSFIPNIFTEKSSTQITSPNKATESCPVWSNSSAEFQRNNNSRFLGSREELSYHLNLICSKSDVPTLCQTASGLVNYICEPSKPAQYSKVIDEASNSTSAICQTFQNKTFLSQLREAASQSLNSKTNQVSSSNLNKFSMGECENQCNSSLLLCQIILQSLKTIIHGVELKNEVSNPTESNPTPTAVHTKTKAINATALQKSLDNATTMPTPAKPTEKVSEKTTTESAVKETTPKNLDPLILPTDGANEEDLDDEMEKPSLLINDPDSINESDTATSKENDAYGGTPTKPPHSYDSESEIDEEPVNTHFIFYFLAFVVISVCGYLLYQRRYRIVALVLEGRGGSIRRRGRASRSRGSSGSYRKLVNNLEEAVTSHSVNNSNVVY